MDSEDVHQRWKQRSGEYSPDYYVDLGPTITSEYIYKTLDYFVDSNAAILELGCSSGRHLAYLNDHGYHNLYGVEINDDAIDVMAETYPNLVAEGTFYIDAIENVVTEFDDDHFGAIYSVETLELLPPNSEWVFEELARITDDLLITVENEGTDEQQSSEGASVEYIDDDFPLYYRRWDNVFTEFGFINLYSKSLEMDTLRIFRPTEYYSSE